MSDLTGGFEDETGAHEPPDARSAVLEAQKGKILFLSLHEQGVALPTP